MKKRFLILGIIIAVVLIQALLSPALRKLELSSYDIRSKVSIDAGLFSNKFTHADKNIVLVNVDDYSMNKIEQNPQLEIGEWPWPRGAWANILRFIERGQPKAVLFDIVFSEGDNVSYSRAFSRALRRYDNVVLSTTLGDRKADQVNQKDVLISDYIPTSKSLVVQNYDKKADDKITYYSHAPLADIYSEQTTMGVANKMVGKDSVLRSSQPIFKLVKGDETYYMPSLAFAGFLKYMGDDRQITIKNNKLFYGTRAIPLDDQVATPINWHGRGRNYPSVHVSQILLNWGRDKDLKSDFFKDKIVIVGRPQPKEGILKSAVNHSYSSSEAVATAIDNYINDTDINNTHARKFISKAPKVIEYGVVILFCTLVAVAMLFSVNAIFAVLNSGLIISAYALLCIYIFADPSLRIWMPIATPIFYMVAVGLLILGERLYTGTVRKIEIKNHFGNFVAPKILAKLLMNLKKLRFKSRKNHVTVMFCDVKDFTSLTEKSNPEQLVKDLNELFGKIVKIITDNNGTIDKVVGDCIIAYWGDPISSVNDAYRAVKTSIEIRKKVDDLKIANIKEGKIIFDVKIGINTGDALLGLVGFDKIMSYTAMGNTVNIASGLEAACSKLNRSILISKATYDETKGKIVVLGVGEVEVKGDKIEVYEPIGFSEN